MNEPPRLIDDSEGLMRELLESGRNARAPHHTRARALSALAGASTLSATTFLQAAPQIGALGIAKWVGIGALLGLVTASVAQQILPSGSERESEPTSVAVPPLRVAPVATPRAPTRAAPQPLPPRAATVATQKTSGANRSSSSAPTPDDAPPAIDAAGLAREVRVIDDARMKLRSGNAAGALVELDRHAREFPGGKLQPEATLLRIEALVRSGDVARAQSLAQPILDRTPEGPYAERLRRVLAGK